MTEKKKYITGVDGIRSIAVIAVILYHLFPQLMPGGYLGVPLFFVISGYLITDILLKDWDQDQKIHVSRFYVHRLRRLIPSLVGMLVMTSAFFTVFARPLLNNFRSIFLSSILNVNNWWQIIAGNSYFEHLAKSPYTHLWSLSIEGQFYFVFPVLLGLILKYQKKFTTLAKSLLVFTILSACLCAGVFYFTTDINRVYYGTDTRLFSILMGSLLALYLRVDHRNKWNQKQVFGVGMAGLVVILNMFYFAKDYSRLIYLGGFVLFSFASALILFSVVTPNSIMNRIFTNIIFTWIGKRSYEIYLWQYPVMVGYEYLVPSEENVIWLHFTIKILLIILLSEGTYRWIEQPFRRGQIRITKRKIREHIVTTSSFIFVLLLFLTGFVVAGSGKADSSKQIEQQLQANKKLIADKNQGKKAPLKKNENEHAESFTAAELEKAKNLSISGIGDSLLLNVAPNLLAVFPKIQLDGEVGRQLYNSEAVFKKFINEKKMGENVLIILGTNGAFTHTQIEEIIQTIGVERTIFFVNTHVPESWQNQVNQTLVTAGKEHDNVHIIDWKKKAKNHQEDWFYEDGVHMNEEGAKIFTTFVAKQILAYE